MLILQILKQTLHMNGQWKRQKSPDQEGVDLLLAIGGGSVIDTAKFVGIELAEGDAWNKFFKGGQIVTKTLPVGTVLTIAATGSEGSNSCVISKERKEELRWGCNSP